MDEKLKYINKYRDLGYEIDDENGIIIFYVDRDSYSKGIISEIRKIISESKYSCSWGIRPKKATDISSKDTISGSSIEGKVPDNITPFAESGKKEIIIEDDLEEEFKLQDEKEQKVEKEGEKAKADASKAAAKKEPEDSMIFTQESLFDLF